MIDKVLYKFVSKITGNDIALLITKMGDHEDNHYYGKISIWSGAGKHEIFIDSSNDVDEIIAGLELLKTDLKKVEQ